MGLQDPDPSIRITGPNPKNIYGSTSHHKYCVPALYLYTPHFHSYNPTPKSPLTLQRPAAGTHAEQYPDNLVDFFKRRFFVVLYLLNCGNTLSFGAGCSQHGSLEEPS
jgi:hypothetical protein